MPRYTLGPSCSQTAERMSYAKLLLSAIPPYHTRARVLHISTPSVLNTSTETIIKANERASSFSCRLWKLEPRPIAPDSPRYHAPRLRSAGFQVCAPLPPHSSAREKASASAYYLPRNGGISARQPAIKLSSLLQRCAVCRPREPGFEKHAPLCGSRVEMAGSALCSGHYYARNGAAIEPTPHEGTRECAVCQAALWLPSPMGIPCITHTATSFRLRSHNGHDFPAVLRQGGSPRARTVVAVVGNSTVPPMLYRGASCHAVPLGIYTIDFWLKRLPPTRRICRGSAVGSRLKRGRPIFPSPRGFLIAEIYVVYRYADAWRICRFATAYAPPSSLKALSLRARLVLNKKLPSPRFFATH
jgi:hypothetical protein